jgi:hypothetical protein
MLCSRASLLVIRSSQIHRAIAVTKVSPFVSLEPYILSSWCFAQPAMFQCLLLETATQDLRYNTREAGHLPVCVSHTFQHIQELILSVQGLLELLLEVQEYKKLKMSFCQTFSQHSVSRHNDGCQRFHHMRSTISIQTAASTQQH